MPSGSISFFASLGWAITSPVAAARMPRRSWAYFALYVALAGGLLLLTARQLAAHQADIEAVVLGYVFPESWHVAARWLVESLFASQQRIVLINAVVATSLMVVSLILFPVKELLSLSFERGAGLVDEPVEEHPLWVQGWEEVQLFLALIAAQGSVLLIGYLPHPACKTIAAVASYLLVCVTFALDFISPVWQRHGGYYSRIVKTQLRHPLAALAFGALLSAPVQIVGLRWEADPSWSWTAALTVLFGVNVLCIAWAAAAGTWFGSKLWPTFVATSRSGPTGRRVGWLVLLVLLAGNGLVYGALGRSVHHKSQILKCEYSVDLRSFGVDTPGLGDLLSGSPSLSVHADVRIQNPTPFDVVVEDHEVVATHRGTPFARTRLTPVTVPAGHSVEPRISFTVEVDRDAVARGTDLFDADAWALVLYIDIAPYLRAPILLMGDWR